MTKEQLLDFNIEYIGAIRLSYAVKEKLIALDAPCRQALFQLIDGELERLYGEPYEQERIIFEAGKIING